MIGDELVPPQDVRVVDDRDELVAYFADRPAVHIYALADLDEPFWSASRWFRRHDAVVGVVGLPSGEGVACYAVSTRDPAGTLGLLVDLAPQLPDGLLITGPVGTGHAIRSVREVVWDGPHVRYELTERGALPPVDQRLVDLGRADVDDLSDLYAVEPGAAFFLPHMLDDETFVGIRDGERLVAVAGTHVLSRSHRLAAIGAVYTHPSHRGRGLGRAVTAGVVARLGDRVDVIGLNVHAENASARRIYDSIGFTAIHPYDEAQLA